MAKKKFYAIAVGRNSGIFKDWATAEKQVKGYAGAKFKSFPTLGEAETWLTNPVYEKKKNSPQKQQKLDPVRNHEPDAIVVYTDGGAINNPGPGGYGVVIDRDGDRKELSGGFRHTTNNRMEMMAAVVALKQLGNCNQKIYLYSDSSYLVNGISKGWARKWQKNGWRKSDKGPVMNVDLWQLLLTLLTDLDVQFQWVKGHAGLELNERCDRLAVSAARSTHLPVDTHYEDGV
jgi:ribonuclease HI